jgi:exonuclease VII small subunit
MNKSLVNSLGQAQKELELASKAFQEAQDAFIKAQNKLQTTEDRYNTALATLVSQSAAVRQQNKVVPLTVKF